MLSILVIVNRPSLIFPCKFTFAYIIEMPLPHGHCKFRDDCIVQLFSKSPVSLKKGGLEYYFERFT